MYHLKLPQNYSTHLKSGWGQNNYCLNFNIKRKKTLYCFNIMSFKLCYCCNNRRLKPLSLEAKGPADRILYISTEKKLAAEVTNLVVQKYPFS